MSRLAVPLIALALAAGFWLLARWLDGPAPLDRSGAPAALVESPAPLVVELVYVAPAEDKSPEPPAVEPPPPIVTVTPIAPSPPPPAPAATPAREPRPVEARPAEPVAETLTVSPLRPTEPPPPQATIQPRAVAPEAVAPPKPLRPTPKPRPMVETKPEPMDEPEPASPEPIKTSDPQTIAAGRTLLKLLEHGKGPRIEIAWPGGGEARERLFQYFQRCHGMTVALIDDANRLFTAESFEPWRIDLDRYSGFVREANGAITRSQTAVVAQIQRHHPGLGRARAVHVFPRAVDAALLGGLKRLIGEAYAEARDIRAVYRQDGATVAVEAIRVGGVDVAGRIELPSRGRACA